MSAALSTREPALSPLSLRVLRAYATNDVDAFARVAQGDENEQTAWSVAVAVLIHHGLLIEHRLTTRLRWISLSDAGKAFLASPSSPTRSHP